MSFRLRITLHHFPTPPFQEDDEIPSPSPELEQPPSQDVHYPALTEHKDQQDRDEDIPSPLLHPSFECW